MSLQVDTNVLLEQLRISAKNAWFWTKNISDGALGKGIQFLGKAGTMTSELYSDAINAYFDKVAERARGIVVAKAGENGELTCIVKYEMQPTSSGYSVTKQFWVAVSVVKHAMGLDYKPKVDTCEKCDGDSLPEVKGKGLRDVEVVEEYKDDGEIENEHQELLRGAFEGRSGGAHPNSMGDRAKLRECEDDGSYLIVILKKDEDEDEQIKKIERGLAECKYKITTLKKSSVHDMNRNAFEKKKTPPLPEVYLKMTRQHEQETQKMGIVHNADDDNDYYDDDGDDDDDDDDLQSFRIPIEDE